MEINVINLEKNLRKQIELYEKIEEIELQKSDVIIDKDGKSLGELAFEQEQIMKNLSVLEEDRLEIIKKYISDNKLNDLDTNLPLRKIITSMDEDSAHVIYEVGTELKKLVLRIQKLNETNTILMKDNMEFFNILTDSLKQNQGTEGYTLKGNISNGSVRSSVLFNKTV